MSSDTPLAGLPRRLSQRSPKGEQLRAILEDLIAQLRPGDALPSERELAERYGVARTTVRGELMRLASEGTVERVQGRGTFVAEPRVAQASTLSSFTEDMRARGLTPGSRVLAQEVQASSEVVAGHLGVEPGTPVVLVRRLRLADGDPMALEDAYLPAARFAGLEDADLESASLFALLAERWDVALATAEERVLAVEIVGDDANLLRVAPGRAGLLFQSVQRDVDDAVVAWSSSLFRGDRYEIRLLQHREGAA
jgi:GntR family transcriptional regulator